MLDFYAYRSELKSSLLQNWQRLELENYPLDWAWMLYALSAGQALSGQQMTESVDRSLRWIEAEATWSADGNLGAIGLLCCVLRQEGRPAWEDIAARLAQRVQQLTGKTSGTFSRLNDPLIVYGIVAGCAAKLPSDLRAQLEQHCQYNSQLGNWRRRLLFSAACVELGSTAALTMPASGELSIDEAPCAVWFAETFHERVPDAARRELWELVAHLKEQILIEPVEGDRAPRQLYQASPIDVAMLYLATVPATEMVDPVVLFRNFPLHPRVRLASESLFLNGEYSNAVLEAAKAFLDEIKHKAGYPTGPKGRTLDGNSLIQQVFQTKNPILKFNALVTSSEKDEHRGLEMIAEGVWTAIRNPKSHTTKDQIVITPYQALEELAIISYIYKRVETAQSNTGKQH